MNSETIVGCEDGEAKSGPRSTIMIYGPGEGSEEGEAPRRATVKTGFGGD